MEKWKVYTTVTFSSIKNSFRIVYTSRPSTWPIIGQERGRSSAMVLSINLALIDYFQSLSFHVYVYSSEEVTEAQTG
jgi:hypothetical protein